MIPLRSIFFDALFYIGTGMMAVFGLPVMLGSRRMGARFARFWAKATLWLGWWSVGLRYEVRGRENLPPGPCIIAVKHQSAWDALAAMVIFDDPAIVVKRELFSIPLYGWYLRKAGMIFLDRAAGVETLRRMLTQARSAVAEGRPIVIFPEGTRTAVGAVTAYHPGVGALVRDLRLPVVPVALNSGLFWGRRKLVKRPGLIVVEILPALASGIDRRKLTDELRDRIEAATACLVREAGTPVGKLVD